MVSDHPKHGSCCRSTGRPQGDAVSVDQQMVLGAGLAAVDRIRAGQLPPRRARTLTGSIEALDQSTWLSSPS
jgi:hypothetical protein